MRLHRSYIFYAALTSRRVPKPILRFSKQSACVYTETLLQSLSIVTERLSPGLAEEIAAERKTKRVWISGAVRAPLDKSVGSLNRRVGRSPKRPTNAL